MRPGPRTGTPEPESPRRRDACAPAAPRIPRPGERRGSTPAGARLLATQMAVSGSSRAEIEARLRNGFAIDDTRAILDAILGPDKKIRQGLRSRRRTGNR